MNTPTDTTTKMKRDIDRSCEVDEMHLMDAEAEEEEAFCKAEVSVHDLISVQGYLERRTNGLSLPTICETCRVVAGQWAEDRRLGLEADARELRASGEELQGMAVNGRTNAESLRRQAGQADMDAARYGSSAEWRNLEADQLEDEADGCRQLVDMLARETGLNP